MQNRFLVSGYSYMGNFRILQAVNMSSVTLKEAFYSERGIDSAAVRQVFSNLALAFSAPPREFDDDSFENTQSLLMPKLHDKKLIGPKTDKVTLRELCDRGCLSLSASEQIRGMIARETKYRTLADRNWANCKPKDFRVMARFGGSYGYGFARELMFTIALYTALEQKALAQKAAAQAVAAQEAAQVRTRRRAARVERLAMREAQLATTRVADRDITQLRVSKPSLEESFTQSEIEKAYKLFDITLENLNAEVDSALTLLPFTYQPIHGAKCGAVADVMLADLARRDMAKVALLPAASPLSISRVLELWPHLPLFSSSIVRMEKYYSKYHSKDHEWLFKSVSDLNRDDITRIYRRQLPLNAAWEILAFKAITNATQGFSTYMSGLQKMLATPSAPIGSSARQNAEARVKPATFDQLKNES
ncbi:MAG TPA: hypothetical protein VFR09_06775 [Alphaproteobacteria bacterium]|nr:hypothetical protein [Alphaproteobacteria bacterium]